MRNAWRTTLRLYLRMMRRPARGGLHFSGSATPHENKGVPPYVGGFASDASIGIVLLIHASREVKEDVGGGLPSLLLPLFSTSTVRFSTAARGTAFSFAGAFTYSRLMSRGAGVPWAESGSDGDDAPVGFMVRKELPVCVPSRAV